MYILVGSITTAMRLKRLLERNYGIPSDVMHTPSELNHGGCSYSVRTKIPNISSYAKIIAEEYGISIRKIYAEELVNGERVFHAIS